MANWQYKLNFKDLWKKHKAGEMPIYEVAENATSRIEWLLLQLRKRGHVYQDLADEMEYDILPQIEAFAEDKNENPDDFDYILEDLYNWADTALDNEWPVKRLCWVATF